MNKKRALEKTYSIDMDGNFAHFETPILLEKKQDDWRRKLFKVLSKDYDHNPLYEDKNMYRPLDNDLEKTFMHARDSYLHPEHRGMEWRQQDFVDAVLKREYWPSFYRTLFDIFLQGKYFSINTARGHTSENMKVAIYKMLIALLSPYGLQLMANNIRERYKISWFDSDKKIIWRYLDQNMYYGWANIELKKQFMISQWKSSAEVKTLMQDNYIRYLHHFSNEILKEPIDYRIKMWFSDDGYENTKHMLHYFIEKRKSHDALYDPFQFRLYYTWLHLDIVKSQLEQEIVDLLWCDHDIVLEKKEYSLQYYQQQLDDPWKSVFQDDRHNYNDQLFESLKIML